MNVQVDTYSIIQDFHLQQYLPENKAKMGCYQTKIDPNIINSKNIDRTLNLEKSKIKKEMKILSLGTAGSGKSTFFKQMKVIHLGGFSEEERRTYRDGILISIFNFTYKVLDTYGVFLLDPYESEIYQKLRHLNIKKTPQEISHESHIFDDLMAFFQSENCKKFLANTNENIYSLVYFVNKIDEILKDDYIPTTEDILHVRIPTTGVVEMIFDYKNIPFRMIDVGGQSSERRKWFHCFADVNAIIFVVDISSYDLISSDDGKMNSLIESLAVFSTVCSNCWLKNSSMIIFYNKVDLFESKLSKTPLSVCWPTCEDSNNFESAAAFVQMQFETTFKNHNQNAVYSFFTCATDTKNVDKAFQASSDMILNKNLALTGLV